MAEKGCGPGIRVGLREPRLSRQDSVQIAWGGNKEQTQR